MPQPFPTHLFLLLAAGTLATASCAREEATPSPEASYSRSVVYLDQASPAQHDTAYQAAAVQASAKLQASACVIQLHPTSGREELALSVPRGQLPAGLVGSYAFQAPATAGQAPSYEYRVNKRDKPAGGEAWAYASWWLPSTATAAGTVEITAYDAKRQLLSGRFQLTLARVYDPRARSTESSTRRCNLTLTGTFANVPVAAGQ